MLTKIAPVSLITLLFASLLVISISVNFESVNAATSFNGIINTDTTWTKVNSPYEITGNVLVNNNITLTIEPGVVINLNNYYIMINGTLRSVGTQSDFITITGISDNNGGGQSGEIIFTPYSTTWNESIQSGCIIGNSTITADITVEGGMPYLSSNIITGLTTVDHGSPIIINNKIIGQGIYLGLWSENPQVIDNTISGCSTGIQITVDNSTAVVRGNLIINNTNGILFGVWFPPQGYPIIQNNTITKNRYGLDLSGALSTQFSPTIRYNNIFDNNINMQTSLQINTNATNNWWGTTNTSVISQSIYDYTDDFTLGVVTVDPALTGFNIEAPTYVNASATAGGSISPRGVVKYGYLDSETYKITADSGYHIADVLVNGTSTGLTGNYLLWQITGPTNITALFAADPTPTPTSQPTPNPTSNPTTNPTSNPTTNPTQSPTTQPSPSPAVPEYPSIAVIAILLVAASGAIVFYRRSTYNKTA